MKKILLIDDEIETRQIIRLVLENDGYEVVECDDGRSGLALAQKDPPDLIIADLVMPQFSGFEALRSLRSNPKTQSVPVIVCSARGNVQDRVQSLALGANEFFSKPFDNDELRLTVHQLLKKSAPSTAK